jgi:sigma-B regulation protein RsbU (phosphoserine phosphatase)
MAKDDGRNDPNSDIAKLKKLLELREADITRYKTEVSSANQGIQDLIEKLTKEIKTLHQIQKVLVPTELPHIPGFEFSSKFIPSMLQGGDYFDIFETSDRMHFGLLIASANGPSLTALLISVLLKHLMPSEKKKPNHPQAFLKKLQAELPPESDSAHLFYGLVDRRKHELHFLRYGKIKALYQDYRSQKVELLNGDDDHFKKNTGLPAKPESLLLNPRDRLVFCSPGITQAVNLAGESFGLERVVKAIKEVQSGDVHEVRNHILFSVEQFGEGQEIPRDQTVLVVEVKDRVIRLAR